MAITIRNIANVDELRAAYALAKQYLGGDVLSELNPQYALSSWQQRLREGSTLLITAFEGGAPVGMVWGRDDNGGVTIGPVAVDQAYRRTGWGRKLLQTFEQAAYQAGYRQLTLGSTESAERFYLRCGYTPYLFIQWYRMSYDDSVTLEQLRYLSENRHEIMAYEDNGSVRLMLATHGVDKRLQARYDNTFPSCSTQYIFMKTL